jgi:hypothetical protein
MSHRFLLEDTYKRFLLAGLYRVVAVLAPFHPLRGWNAHFVSTGANKAPLANSPGAQKINLSVPGYRQIPACAGVVHEPHYFRPVDKADSKFGSMKIPCKALVFVHENGEALTETIEKTK